MSEHCGNCGNKMYSGLCTYCDEETDILQQACSIEEDDLQYSPNFSKDFLKKVDEQSIKQRKYYAKKRQELNEEEEESLTS